MTVSGTTGGRLVVEDGLLRVEVDPAVGATITSIRHRSAGAELLWRNPRHGVGASRHEDGGVDRWLRATEGGWQLVLPNGGTECTHQGVRHGFHGEAGLAPWSWRVRNGGLELSVDLCDLPLSVVRSVDLPGPGVLRVSTSVRNDGDRPVELMWGEHIGFGSDLLDDPALRLDCPAAEVTADDEYRAPSNPLTPGARSRWPYAAGPDGPVDLRRPLEGSGALAYLSAVGQPITLTAPHIGLSVAVRWSTTFPFVWFWTELGGGQGPPWFGRARAIGIEPFVSWPSQGLARVAEKTGTQLRISPDQSVSGWAEIAITETARTPS
ncbi:hypothetical protein [Embleya scabrispora]|uniref:hypothetical protein n=1 Tax=Embleya scabrispora TaxID=159449 RepID=UPI00036433DD|nr:hypothetical protein [Embleya scabrispora]MYS86569.1 hypothetical protein [Streptomyces sp. SID5474]